MIKILLDILKVYHASISTLLAGGVAWYLYYKAKKDEIRTATKTIILEIKEAEKIIKFFLDIKNRNESYPTDFFKVTPYKAWNKYSHLFIKKLNNDEYEQINDFYKKCEILEKYIEKNYNFFWVTTEERARQKERIGADFALNMYLQDKDAIKHKERQHFDDVEKLTAVLYMSNTGVYLPAGIKTEIDKTLNSITLIINTPTWNSLKRVAGYKDILG